MKKIDKRFADKIGTEYALFQLASPHYMECQKLVASITAQHTNDTPRILEIGCGTGLTTLELIKAIPGAKITAFDAEEAMLAQAKKVLPKSVELVWADVQFCLNNMDQTGSSHRQSYDAIVSAFCLHNIAAKYRDTIYYHLGRFLKSGGIFVTADKIAEEDPMKHWHAFRDQIEAFSVFQGTDYPELQAEWTVHYLEDEVIKLTERELRHQLRDRIGCKEVQFHQRWGMDAVFSGVKQ